jgi:hypothetical protein
MPHVSYHYNEISLATEGTEGTETGRERLTSVSSVSSVAKTPLSHYSRFMITRM